MFSLSFTKLWGFFFQINVLKLAIFSVRDVFKNMPGEGQKLEEASGKETVFFYGRMPTIYSASQTWIRCHQIIGRINILEQSLLTLSF